jgi:hypothetical protein
LCIGNKQGFKLVFSLLNLVFIGVSPPILDLPYLLLQLHCCSYSSIKLCGNKILQSIWTDDCKFHETVPNLAHFMTTLKLGLKQLNWWYPVSWNDTQFGSLYDHTQIRVETAELVIASLMKWYPIWLTLWPHSN